MSILRYYKKIEPCEFATDNDIIGVLHGAKGGKLLHQYLQCIIAPVRNHGKWTILHPKVRLMRWE